MNTEKKQKPNQKRVFELYQIEKTVFGNGEKFPSMPLITERVCVQAR